MTRGLALLLTVVTAGALAARRPARLPAATGAGVRLTAITSRVAHARARRSSSRRREPVGYVADAARSADDRWSTSATSAAERRRQAVAADAKSPIAGVVGRAVESLGAPASRVRITLTQPVAHHVRSERNTIVVDLDSRRGAAPYVLPPASRPGAEAAPRRARRAAGRIRSPRSGSTRRRRAGRGAGARSAAGSRRRQSRGPARSRRSRRRSSASRRRRRRRRTGARAADQAARRQFTGNPISLDFQGADLRAVLRTFAEISGLNIVIDPAVQGTVDVALRDVPWDQALDIILRANKLGYFVDGTIVRIAPLDRARRRRERSAASWRSAGATPASCATLDAAAQLREGRGDRGAAQAANVLSQARHRRRSTPRTNTLIITDLPDRLDDATDADHHARQAAAAGRDRSAHRADQQELRARARRPVGLQRPRRSPALGNTTNLAFPNSGSLGGRDRRARRARRRHGTDRA